MHKYSWMVFLGINMLIAAFIAFAYSSANNAQSQTSQINIPTPVISSDQPSNCSS